MLIENYVSEVAADRGFKLSKIVLTKGQALGCFDAHLLCLCSGNKLVSEFVHQAELDHLAAKDSASDLLEVKVQSAITRLKMMLN